MATFVDTSAFYAHLEAADKYHERAVRIWDELLEGERLVTHNYVLLETGALLQSRLGTVPVRQLHEEFVPVLDVHWASRDEHDDAFRAVAASGSKAVSIVDRVSFLVMRRTGITRVFTFAPHFADEGFEVVG